ncbi:PREDICTED: syntaxin-5 [Pseudopodoces humilis]|uniref:syntaxin-5 n=1 Tax=Pseudopodoces humilis TaxID=181119 RepID=UPI0006B76A43|nr:PREDICTED: syntaxin-5 [Pseudopodoces humilis]
MQARRRLGPRQREPGAYLGPPQTQIVPPPEPPPADVMSCRDRTQEFLFACKSLQGRQDRGVPAGRAPGPGRQRSEFSLMAKCVGRVPGVGGGSPVAKRKSLFDDKSVEIEELTYIIKQDINSLNKQIAQLQELVRARGGPAGRHLQSHSNTVVVSLQSKLASMSNDFKSVLEVRTENLKQQRSRREHFSRAPVSALAANNLGEPGGPRWESGSFGGSLSPLPTPLSPQGARPIDSSVEDAQLNVEAAHGEILKYFQSVTSNRWLMVKIFLILIVFFIVFVVFLA